MPRYALALIAVITLAAPQAFGQAIQIEGSVQPAAPTGFPVVGDADANDDGVIDFISTGGNGIITTGISQTDPTGGAGNGLPWDARRIYRNYDSAQNILIGDRQQSGRLAISAGGTLRYQHLVLGGVNRTSDGSSPLETTINPLQVPSLVDTFVGAVDAGTGGSGNMTISGLGSLFSNDPNLIDQTVQTALNLASGNTGPITDLNNNTDDTNWPFAGNFSDSTRDFGPATGGYDVIVGLNGNGSLDITAGGRMEVQDALMIGVDSQSNGSVTVDGVGSTLSAFGRTQLRTGGNDLIPTASAEATSFVGGRGTGLLTVSNGGRAEFFNGLSIGAPTGTLDDIRTTAAGDGSGNVTVTGAGSLLSATASSIGSFGNDNLALAVGEIRSDDLTTPFTPATDQNLQSGRLEINDNAVVSTGTGINEFGGNPGNAAIGKRGEVNLGGGQFQVGDNLDNDGVISGYGDVRADTLETSVFSVIRGGNPNSENPELADPLRLVLLDNADTALTNRGLIEGRVNFDVSGTIVNEGQIETSGEIFASELFTSVESRIRQARGTDSPLRLRLNDSTQAGDANGGGANNFGALHNRGSIEGDLDFIVAGGVVNGDNLLPSGGAGSAVSGSINASGRILAGTFVNHSDGEVRVGPGESLSVLANATGTTDFPAGDGIPVQGGGDLTYRSLNLGSISVTGGSLEIGYLPQSGGPFDFLDGGGFFNQEDFFINARYAELTTTPPAGFVTNSAGTITANGGSLGFSTGIINFGGVMAFVGGDNVVNGRVYNADVNYGSGALTTNLPGTIVVSGDGTTVTFEDDVINDGEIAIGPFGSVANFLGDLSGGGTINVALDMGTGSSAGAFITVAGGVNITGGTVAFSFLNAPTTIDTNVSIALITAGELSEESLFTELILPDLADGQFWDIVYDTVNDEVRLEIVESNAFGADFTGDGIVSQDDLDVWIRNAGIIAGASTIQGDADLDGDVDLADYDVLMAQLFTGIPEVVNAGLALVTEAVPEPTTALLLCLAVVSAGAARRR